LTTAKARIHNEGNTPLEVASATPQGPSSRLAHDCGDDTNTGRLQLSDYMLSQHGGKVIVITPKTLWT
jgi:hypothetical protein